MIITSRLLVEYSKLVLRSAARRPRFGTSDVKIGRGVIFGRNVRFACKRVRIGDGVVIQDDVRVEVTDFELGDFGTIYFGCFFPGPGKVKIGHNFWLGNNSIVDGQAETTIGNNVGVGAHSQLWTHMRFGDVVAGCRFDSQKPLNIGDDVWLVGHNLISPVSIGDRSLAMLGSLIVKDIEPDRIVAGSPASDQTGKFGPQFVETPPGKRIEQVRGMIEVFAERFAISNIWQAVEVAESFPPARRPGTTYIDVVGRKYTKTGSLFELLLMRSLLPKAKYIPVHLR
ncbi:MAG TPA: hypothetical protein VIU38_12130 [Anaerolineales bacterium]